MALPAFNMRELIEASEFISHLGFNESGDLEEILDHAEKKVFDITQHYNAGGNFKDIKPLLMEAYERFEKLSSAEHELRGLACIMRHGIRLNRNGADGKTLVAIKYLHGDIRELVTRSLQGAIRQPHRHAKLACKAARATHVIVVFVSNQHGTYRRGFNAAALDTGYGLLQRKSAIGENSSGTGFDDQAVAFAAAAQ